jgi:hypothetical protein
VFTEDFSEIEATPLGGRLRITPSVQDVVFDGLWQSVKLSEIISPLLFMWRHFSRCAVDGLVPEKNEDVEGSSCRGFVQCMDITERQIRRRLLTEGRTPCERAKESTASDLEGVPTSHPHHITDRYVLKIHMFSVGISDNHP